MSVKRVFPGFIDIVDGTIADTNAQDKIYSTVCSKAQPSSKDKNVPYKETSSGTHEYIPRVTTLEEALKSCLPPDLIVSMQRSISSLPKLYNEHKTKFDSLAQTLVANIETIPQLPPYCKVAGSFKKRGIIKVLQRLIVDGHIEPIWVSKHQVERWALFQDDAYSALPETLSQLLRPGILSRISSPTLLQVEDDEIVKRAVTLTCYQLKSKTEHKPKQTNAVVAASTHVSPPTPSAPNVPSCNDLEKSFLNIDLDDNSTHAIPMDMCPFDDSDYGIMDVSALEPTLKTCSNIDRYFKDVYGVCNAPKQIQKGKEETTQLDQTSSKTEVSTPLFPISSGVSECTQNSVVIPVFKKCMYFTKYPSIKLYREFIREFYAFLCKKNQSIHSSTATFPPALIEKFLAPYNRQSFSTTATNEITDIRFALAKYLLPGKKGNVFYNVQPEIKVGEIWYISRGSLLYMINAYKNSPLLIAMIQKHYKHKTIIEYMQHISTAFEQPFEPVKIIGIELPKRIPKLPAESDRIAFCYIQVQKAKDSKEITIPYLPVGVSSVGSFILRNPPTEDTSTVDIYPGAMVRVPIAWYNAKLRGMQMIFMQAIVINIKQSLLALVGMEIRDLVTDAPSTNTHGILNMPKDNEILCYSSNVFSRNKWDVILCPKSDVSILLPQRLCARSLYNIQTNKASYMTDYYYIKRLQKTKLFSKLDCTKVQNIGQTFQLMQMESARDLLRKVKISNADEEVICENSLFILTALMIHPALICLLEADSHHNVTTFYDLAKEPSIYLNFKKLEGEVKSILKRYELEQDKENRGPAFQLAYDAIKTYFFDLLTLYSP